MQKDPTLITIIKIIFLMGILWFLFTLPIETNITYKSKGFYESSH